MRCVAIVRSAQHGLLRIGGASRDRTDDLIVANSQPCRGCSDTEEPRVIQRGSAHAALVAIRCLLPVMERHPPTQPDLGRDGRVTTQSATQEPAPGPPGGYEHPGSGG